MSREEVRREEGEEGEEGKEGRRERREGSRVVGSSSAKG